MTTTSPSSQFHPTLKKIMYALCMSEVRFAQHDLLPGIWRWECNGRWGLVKGPVTDEMVSSIKSMAGYDHTSAQERLLSRMAEYEMATGRKFA